MLDATKAGAAIVAADVGQERASTTETAGRLQVACSSSLLMLHKVNKSTRDARVS
jgi:hypothetical protein